MTTETSNSSSDNYYYLPYTLPVHLPGLVSTNPADSPHMPLPQKAVPPEVPGFTDVPPERMGTDFGMETSFKIVPNDYEVLKDVCLVVHLAPLTAGAGGALPRYPDDPILHAMEYMQWQIGGATVQQLSGDEMHLRNLAEKGPEEYARMCSAQNAGMDLVADRAALAATVGGFYCFVELPFWWSDTSAKHWHQYACQRQTRINIKWRNVDAILQQDVANTRPTPNGSTTYIMDMFLRFRTSALDTAVKDTYTNAVKAQGSNGLNYLIQFTQKQENQIVTANLPQTSIQLTNFNKPTFMTRMIIRTTADMATNYLTGNKRWNFIAPDYFQCDASGHRMWPKMSADFNKWMVNGKEFLGFPCNYNVFHVLHTDYADVAQYPMGCVEYGKLQNPTETIYFPAVHPEYTVDIYAHCYDYVRLVITPDNRSAVTLEQPI